MNKRNPDNLEKKTGIQLRKIFVTEVRNQEPETDVLSECLTSFSPDWSIRQCQGGNYEVSLYFLGRNREGSIRSWSKSMKSAMMIAAIRAKRLGTQ